MEKVKVLITGASGMLGSAICKDFSFSYKVAATDKNDCNVADLEAVKKKFLRFKPQVVIHTAAYTDVDGCERESDLAYKINVLGTKNIALTAKDVNAKLVFISTDYIFDGKKNSAYTEDDPAKPLNIYGQTKLEAEKLIKSQLEKFVIVRTSWLFGENGKNFVDTIIKNAKGQKRLEVVNDQIGSPTYTKDLSNAIRALIEINAPYGVYNITNSQSCSWHEFARTILEYKNIKDLEVVPITSSDLGRPARRPKNSRLDNLKFFRLTKKYLRPWPEALREYLKI